MREPRIFITVIAQDDNDKIVCEIRKEVDLAIFLRFKMGAALASEIHAMLKEIGYVI